MTYETWRVTSRHFSEEELRDESLSGPLADPDRDRLLNLLEFAWDTNPRRRERQSHIRLECLSIGGGTADLLFTYPRRMGGISAGLGTYYSGDIRYSIEFSPDAITWIPAGLRLLSAKAEPVPEGTTEIVAVRLNREQLPAGLGFLRLSVQQLK
jgi:hypothetical protein